MKSNLKILVTDDNRHFLNAFKFVLTDEFQKNIESVHLAKSGKECLDILEQELIDVVFIDIEMPDINGIVLTRQICERYRNILVIALSFHDEMSYVTQVIDAGARFFISKEDVNRHQLMTIFEKHFTV